MVKAKSSKTKKKNKENIENLYVIFLDKIISGKDKRTTLMVRNIPNKYNLQSLSEEINLNFDGKYDFLYLPLDNNNNANLGYAFINFINPYHILMFNDIYKGFKWKKYNSDKICDLTYAKFQGKKELTTHFEKINNPNCQEDKKPLILQPKTPAPKLEIPMNYLDNFKKLYLNIQFDIVNDKFILKNF